MVFQFGNLRTRIAYNTAAQLLAKGLSAGTTFAVSFFLARAYGADSFGDFIKVTTFVGLFFLATDFGLNAQWLKENISWRVLVATRAVLSMVFAAIALIVLSVLPYGVGEGYTGMVRAGIYIFLPALFFQSILTSANAMFQKHLRYDLSTLALAAGVVVVLSSLVVLPSRGIAGSMVGVLAMLGGIAATGIVSSVIAWRMEGAPPSSPITGIRTGQRLFLASVPLGLTLLFNVVYGHVDSIILTTTRSTAEVGLYGFAYKIFEFALALPTFFMNAVYPLLLGALGAKIRFSQLMRKSLGFLIVSSTLLAAVFWISSPLLSFVRAEFAGSAPALRVLSLGLPLFFVSSFVMWALIALGQKRALMFIYGGGMVLNIFLNLLLIPRYGYMAAAWVTVVSEAAILAATAGVLRRALS